MLDKKFDSDAIFNDLARMAGGAASAFSGLRKQIKEEVRARIDDAALRLDLVPREEFERLELMVSKLREEQDKLKENLAALALEGKKAKTPTKKANKKKTTTKKA